MKWAQLSHVAICLEYKVSPALLSTFSKREMPGSMKSREA